MSAGYSSPHNGEYRLQDEENVAPSGSRTVNETLSLSEKGSIETMITRLCPHGYEIAEDPLVASRSGSTEPPLNETLSNLTSQLKIQHKDKILDREQYAAKQGEVLLGVLDWALRLIDTAQSLQTILGNVVPRCATAQEHVVALQKERGEAASLRASIELRLYNAEMRLKIAEDRAMALEKENQQNAALLASMNRHVDYLDREETPHCPIFIKTTG